ncbi:MAG: hypothetical protein N3C12_08045 [Candidatus Binatia bacterium]|nr:hypothetical protein [Candidatus Binatia bacterium]
MTFPLGFWNNRQQAEEAAPVATPTVSPGELERYIAVYQAMHADHSLTIEDAVRPHGVTVEEFRALERRIQDNPRLVEKVREALLEYARANSAIALVPTPTPTKPAPAKQRRK